MSKTLEFDSASELDDEDLRYAIERDMVSQKELQELGFDDPAKLQKFLAGGEKVDIYSRPYSGNHMTLTDEEIRLIEERRKAAEAVPTPTIKVPSAEADEDEEEEYGEGWTNDTRREELARRGQSVDGNKDELIHRLKSTEA